MTQEEYNTRLTDESPQTCSAHNDLLCCLEKGHTGRHLAFLNIGPDHPPVSAWSNEDETPDTTIPTNPT